MSDFEVRVKKWWQSKTIWFNAAMAALMGFADQIAPLLIQAGEYLPQVKPYIPANAYGILMVVSVLGNIYYRFKTSTAVSK